MRPNLPVVLVAAVILARLGGPAAPATPSAERRLHYTPQDRETGRYQYVPIQVPAGTTRLHIAYSYDKAEGMNVVDLGLFEPGPLDLGTSAFRGASGGARSEITVAASEATPGYWPGPLPSGEWHVMLGLYKVAPQGVDVRLTVETSSAPDPAPLPSLAPRPAGPLRSGPAWYSGALHLHTVNSDGHESTAQVCRRAREAGLDFVAITDHNNTTHQLDPVDEPGLLRIVGEEVTTPGGHASVWGIGGWRDYVDFRLLPGDERIKDLVRGVTSRGGVFAINHPRSACLGCAWEHLVPDGIAALEITDQIPSMLAAILWWDSLLARGRRITAVGSSDWHAPDHPIVLASVRVWARELSESAILEGIRAGRVVVMVDGATPPPVLVARAGAAEARVGDTLAVERDRAVTVEVAVPAALSGAHVDLVRDGKVVGSQAVAGGASVRFEQVVSQDGSARAQVYGADQMPVAITNPVYFKVGAAR